MRLQQWAKNGLLFLPLIAAHETDFVLWGKMMWGFLAFGFLASSTYIWNDLMDLNADRQHPVRSANVSRPAKGRILQKVFCS